MIDTNVLISALLRTGSVPDQALNLVCDEHDLVLCDHIIEECYDVAQRRFPSKLSALNDLFAKLRYELVPAPRGGSVTMRDAKDQPILDAAILYGIDALVTGDKHFLGLALERPQIMPPGTFVARYGS